MKIEYSNTEVEHLKVPEPYHLLIGVGATLRFLDNKGRTLFEEPDFPIVELAVAIKDWLKQGVDQREDFNFTSVESSDEGLVWCRLQAPDAWAVGALEQEFPDPDLHSTAEVTEAFGKFVTSVDGWMYEHLGKSLSDAHT